MITAANAIHNLLLSLSLLHFSTASENMIMKRNDIPVTDRCLDFRLDPCNWHLSRLNSVSLLLLACDCLLTSLLEASY